MVVGRIIDDNLRKNGVLVVLFDVQLVIVVVVVVYGGGDSTPIFFPARTFSFGLVVAVVVIVVVSCGLLIFGSE